MILILIFPILLFSQYRDKIIAVINEEPVLLSEVEEVYSFYKLQFEENISPEKEKEIKKSILDEIVREKLLYIEAKGDTNLEVTEEEVEEELNRKIEELKTQMGEEEFEKELQKENLTLVELKKRYREDVRRNLFIQKYIAMYIQPKIMVSPDELREFYEKKRDSIPEEEEGFYISHILIRILPDKEKIEKARLRAENVYNKLREGGDFEYLAFKYSDDRQSAVMGGEIGYVQRGIFPPEIEEKIFSLKKGEFTEPIKSDYGYYIFKVIDKKENEVKLAQIVLGALPDKEDSLKALKRAKEAREYALKESFEKAVQNYSDDFISRERNGNLGFIPVKGMDPGIKEVIIKLKPGEISEPVLGAIGYHIFRLERYQEGGKPSFEEIQNDLRTILIQRKLRKEIDRVVENIKKRVFVEIKNFED